MKILLFTEIFDCGGVDTFLINLINNWPADDSFVIVANSNYPGLAHIEERVQRRLVVVRHGKLIYANVGLNAPLSRKFKRLLSPLLRYIFLAWNVISLRSVLNSVGADVLMVVNGGYPGGDSCRAAAISWGLFAERGSSVHNFHNLVHRSAWHTRLQDWFVDKFVAKFTGSFVTVSDASARSMQLRPMIATKSDVRYIHNGYAPSIHGGQARPVLRTELGIGADTPLCLMLGTYEPRKGHEFLLDAFKLVLEQVPDAHLAVCGFGFPEEMGHVQSCVAQRRLEGSVHLMDFRRDLENLLASADILVVASQAFESFGYTSVEAMAHRIPVVATDVGGVPEVVVSGEGGFCISKDDTAGFAQAIVRLLKDPALRIAQGELGYARYRAHFSSRVMAEKYADLLHSAVIRRQDSV